ncbi:Calcium uniporter protein 5, mitochondrial [Grifola frondosa]|uniref:Calcium uniporter protein, mitochondrial n=1 Tax=Grifola frondosa TaxID=5627 RepID=A0A1C7MJ64_GRIFR|nr:Calcium uniporter protein 5, mitochondrial [Grifola frondosa]
MHSSSLRCFSRLLRSPTPGTLIPTPRARRRWLTTTHEVENTNVAHSRFLAEASIHAKWKDTAAHNVESGGMEATGAELDCITEGKGKLSSTSSHLFKLIIHLGHVGKSRPSTIKAQPPIVFLLHPSQPLSHVSRLILGSLAPATRASPSRAPPRADTRSSGPTQPTHGDEGGGEQQQLIRVDVPSFADRTRFLHRRLRMIDEELARMEALKRACDREAHRGARRMALGGFAMLLAYWGTVARLTFWDFGWDVMEPITYLSGLSSVIVGYLCSHAGSYSVGGRCPTPLVLHHSISARREALYKERGLDIERWMDLVSEGKSVRGEIGRIAEDYDETRWSDQDREEKEKEKRERGSEEPEDVEDEPGDADDGVKEREKEREGDQKRADEEKAVT